ncbi:MAG: hypothetical protein PVI23_07270 [Maricaulaceae bacterium]|jgi:hypothetical protein
MPIEHSYSEPDRILEIRFIGEVSGDEYVDFYVQLARDHRDAGFFDEVIDLLRYEGGIDNAALKDLATRINKSDRAKSKNPMTIFVTHDGRFDAWLEFIRSTFQFRRYGVARTVEDAYKRVLSSRTRT